MRVTDLIELQTILQNLEEVAIVKKLTVTDILVFNNWLRDKENYETTHSQIAQRMKKHRVQISRSFKNLIKAEVLIVAGIAEYQKAGIFNPVLTYALHPNIAPVTALLRESEIRGTPGVSPDERAFAKLSLEEKRKLILEDDAPLDW